LPKEVKILTESYIALIKEIDDINKWKDILCPWNRKTSTVKMYILSKGISTPNAISNILLELFAEIEKILKLHETTKIPNSQINLEQMNKACVKLSHYLILKYYYKDIVIKTT
jgi:hypothetical protein